MSIEDWNDVTIPDSPETNIDPVLQQYINWITRRTEENIRQHTMYPRQSGRGTAQRALAQIDAYRGTVYDTTHPKKIPVTGYIDCKKHGVVDIDPCPICNRSDFEAISSVRVFGRKSRNIKIEVINCCECSIECRTVVNYEDKICGYSCCKCNNKKQVKDNNAWIKELKQDLKTRKPDEFGLRPNGNDAYLAVNRGIETMINTTTKEKRSYYVKEVGKPRISRERQFTV